MYVTSVCNFFSLPPATKLGQGYIFTGVCHSVNRGVSGLGGCLVRGVSASPGGCPVMGGVCSRGVSAQGGVCSLGVFAPGVSAW